jgi:hypothetical protein
MDNKKCLNYNSCQLINEKDFLPSSLDKKKYIKDYCENNDNRSKYCKRYIVKESLGFCPDFVLPDTTLSVEDIIKKFDDTI